MSGQKQIIEEILIVVEKLTGQKAVYIPFRGRHAKVRTLIFGTEQDFRIITKEFRSGCQKKNYYSQMRRKINERIEAVKARQTPLM